MSSQLLYGTAAGLGFLLGLFHSIMGERALIQPLTKLDGFRIAGKDQEYTRLVIRAAWHLTTLLCWAISMVLLTAAFGIFSEQLTAIVFGGLFLICGLASLGLTKGRHPSWALFLIIGVILTIVSSVQAQ